MLVQFLPVTLYELLVLISVRNWLRTENYRGENIRQTNSQTNIDLYIVGLTDNVMLVQFLSVTLCELLVLVFCP